MLAQNQGGARAFVVRALAAEVQIESIVLYLNSL